MNNEIDMNTFRIGVVGAGSWGTALANLLAIKGFKVDLWVFELEVLAEIKSSGKNNRFLPGIKLSTNLYSYNNINTVVSGKDLLIFVTPSHILRSVVNQVSSLISYKTILISASKGIENITYMTMSSVIKSEIKNIDDSRLAVLSGPSFAQEVAEFMPTVVTIASKDKKLGRLLQIIFSTSYFRVYTIDDIIGAELGASVKNVIAIAAGIIDGLGMGLNTRAALITRGLTEIRRLGLAMGANPRTFTGLAGVGDLILTATGKLSRNYSIGKEIAEGKRLKDLISDTKMVVEGVKTAESVYNLSKKVNVDMPISHSIYKVLYEHLDPKQALHSLMTRELKQELDIN